MKPKSQQMIALRQVLLACNYMKGQDSRHQLWSDLQKDYDGIRYRSSSDDALEIASMIDACFVFGEEACFETFLTILQGFEGENNETMKAVWRTWKAIKEASVKTADVPSVLQPPITEGGFVVLSEPVTPAASQDISRVGRELHWDRENVVNKFVDIVKRTPGKQDIRVLVIPAPAEADPESLMRRLEAICERMGRTPGTWPRPNCALVQLRSGMQVSAIVTEILSVLASKGGQCADYLDQTRERIENEWRTRRTPEPSTATLAKDFTACLARATETCFPVILLHDFHNLPEDGQAWLKTSWLTRHAPELQDILVVLAGASGLDGLSRPPHMLSFDPLPQLTVDQLFAWAREGHNLKKVTREKVARVNEDLVHGNPARFYTCIITWKIDEELEAGSSPA